MADNRGYQEIEHTADWALRVWAPDMIALLETAARGMYALAGTVLQPEPRQSRSLEVDAPDAESLLVDFLSELLFLGEQEGLGFDVFDLRLDGEKLSGRLEGAPIASQQKEIKAVTFHDLEVVSGPNGLEATVVFDV